MNHIGTHPIETERLILRRYVLEDAPMMFKNWASDPEVTKYLTWPPLSSVEVTRQIIAHPGGGVRLVHGPRLVGERLHA